MDLVYLQLPLVFSRRPRPWPRARSSAWPLHSSRRASRRRPCGASIAGRFCPWSSWQWGVIAAVAFMNTPQSALLVIQGIDPGAFGFAVFMAVAFAVVALVYWVVAMVGRLSDGARKAFATVVAVLAVVCTRWPSAWPT